MLSSHFGSHFSEIFMLYTHSIRISKKEVAMSLIESWEGFMEEFLVRKRKGEML